MFPTLAVKATWNYDEKTGQRVELHPAWRAIVDLHPDVTLVQPWEPGKVKHIGAAWDWQIALSMIVRGYGLDVQREQFTTIADSRMPGGWPLYRYTLPPMLIPVDDVDEGGLELNPAIDPAEIIAYYARTHPQREVFVDLLTSMKNFENAKSALGEALNGSH